MNVYDSVFNKLNIKKQEFDKIIADKGIRREIFECLMFCYENVESLKDVASILLQHISEYVQNADGGPGSGNFGHEGRPGEVGGSALSGKMANSRVKDAYNYKKLGKPYSHVYSEIRKVMSECPVGSKVSSEGKTYTKVGDNKWEYEWIPGKTTTCGDNYILNGVDATAPEKAPEFEIPDSQKVAESMIASGEMKAEEAPSAIKPASREMREKWISDPGYQKGIRTGRDKEGVSRFESYISSEPDYQGTMYRGVGYSDDSFIRSLRVGTPVNMGGISSWTKFQDVAEDYSLGWTSEGEYPVGVVFRMQGGHGTAELKESGEGEVILSNSEKMVVSKIARNGDDGDWIVDLKRA